jgi:hypothetical protein
MSKDLVSAITAEVQRRLASDVPGATARSWHREDDSLPHRKRTPADDQGPSKQDSPPPQRPGWLN